MGHYPGYISTTVLFRPSHIIPVAQIYGSLPRRYVSTPVTFGPAYIIPVAQTYGTLSRPELKSFQPDNQRLGPSISVDGVP